jgi:hypothetical protein
MSTTRIAILSAAALIRILLATILVLILLLVVLCHGLTPYEAAELFSTQVPRSERGVILSPIMKLRP